MLLAVCLALVFCTLYFRSLLYKYTYFGNQVATLSEHAARFGRDKPRTPDCYKFVLSLTTSPSRVHYLHSTLASFNSSNYERIVLNVPKLYRGTEAYDKSSLVALKQRWPKLTINEIPNDLGPQTKLLGLLYNDAIRDDEFAVVIDDDTVYPAGLLQSYAQERPNASTVYAPIVEDIHGIRVTAGFRSFCVSGQWLNQNAQELQQLVQTYDATNKYCKRHDDFLFGKAFQKLGLGAVQLRATQPVLQLQHGSEADALSYAMPSTLKHYVCANTLRDL